MLILTDTRILKWLVKLVCWTWKQQWGEMTQGKTTYDISIELIKILHFPQKSKHTE
jgi:hypothetical protein